jgi:hypothetical protein
VGFKALAIVVWIVVGYSFSALGDDWSYRTVTPKVEIFYNGDSHNTDFSECPAKIPVRVFKYNNGVESGDSLVTCFGKIDGVTYKLNYVVSVEYVPVGSDLYKAGKYLSAAFRIQENNGRGDIEEIKDRGVMILPNDYRGSATLPLLLTLPTEAEEEDFHSILGYVTFFE